MKRDRKGGGGVGGLEVTSTATATGQCCHVSGTAGSNSSSTSSTSSSSSNTSANRSCCCQLHHGRTGIGNGAPATAAWNSNAASNSFQQQAHLYDVPVVLPASKSQMSNI